MLKLSTDGWIRQGDKEGKQFKVANRWMDTSER